MSLFVKACPWRRVFAAKLGKMWIKRGARPADHLHMIQLSSSETQSSNQLVEHMATPARVDQACDRTLTVGGAYLLSRGFVHGHVALQLRAAAKGIGAQRAGKALLILLVAILDVFLQRRQPLVATLAVRAGEQLGKVVRRGVQRVWRHRGGQRWVRTSASKETPTGCWSDG